MSKAKASSKTMGDGVIEPALFTHDGYRLHVIDGVPYMTDDDLADRLGFGQDRDIRKLIKRQAENLRLLGQVDRKPRHGGAVSLDGLLLRKANRRPGTRGPIGDAYYLTQQQVRWIVVEMRFYARSYMAQKTADENFLRWEACHAAALLLERQPDRSYPDYGLNGRQLAEGARIAARRMALLLAEAPTPLREVLALKIHTFESMAPLPDEGNRSNTIFMLETAMKTDAERLGIVLLPLSQPRGRAQ